MVSSIALLVSLAGQAVSRPVAVLYVGTEPCSASARKSLLENPSAAAKFDFAEMVIGKVAIVWNKNDPALRDMRRMSEAFDAINNEVVETKSSSFKFETLGEEAGAGFLASMVFALQALPGARITVCPVVRVRAKGDVLTMNASAALNRQNPSLGFEINPGGRDYSASPLLVSLNAGTSYVRSVDVIGGNATEGKKQASKAMELFDRNLEELRAEAGRSFMKLHNSLLKSAGFASDFAGATTFAALPKGIQNALKGTMRTRWSMMGLSSFENAEAFFSNAKSISVFPGISFGVSILQSDGTISSGFYEMSGPRQSLINSTF